MRRKLDGFNIWIEVENNRAYIYHNENDRADEPYEIIDSSESYGIKNDIYQIASASSDKDRATRVLDWLESPSCPLVDDGEDADSREDLNSRYN